MLLGACFSTLALSLFAAGVQWPNSALLITACAAAGAAGFGFMFLAGLTAVNAAAGERRAAAVSGYLLWSYVGFGVPSLLIGWLADSFGEAVVLIYGTGVAAIAFTVLLMVVRTYRPPATVTPVR
jgi:predicted MFS family arabinose efflux permease